MIDIRLTSPIVRFAFLGIVVSAGLFGSHRVARLAWAQEQLDSFNLSRVQRAIAIDPRNAALHDWAGVLIMSGGEQSFAAATGHFRCATESNPYVARYWLHLGSSCFVAGDSKCADSAFENAATRAPMSPAVVNEVATYYLAAEESDRALAYFRRVLALNPKQAAPAFLSCLRAMEPGQVWESILRDNEDFRLKLAFVTVLKGTNGADVADRYWTEIVTSQPKAIALEDAKPYLAQLEAEGDFSRLARVWQDLESLRAKGLPVRPHDNLVVNGNFEQGPTDLGLDWHLRAEQFLETHLMNDDGRPAFELDFAVAQNLEHEPLSQIVSVSPATWYQLSARVRSEEITSDSGPRVRVIDPQCPHCLNATGENTTGTTDWHEVKTQFETGANTNFIRLSVWRPRSRSFPTEIRGRYWINAVSIQRMAE